jgi:hypothetical protein
MRILETTVAAPVKPKSLSFDLVICVVLIVLFGLAATSTAKHRDIGTGFDETAHVSYVAYLQSLKTSWPRLEDMRMLDPVTFRFSGEANYLNHPSPYYKALAVVGPRLEGNAGALETFRLINVMIGVLGFAALLAIALAARLSRSELYAYAIPLAGIPVLPQIVGSVNNDNLAFAGGAMAMLAAVNLLATGRGAWLAAALVGLVAASWAKFTGLMLAGGFVAVVIGYLVLRGRLPRAWLAPVVLAFLIAAAPYIGFVLQYHSVVPNTPAQIAMLEDTSKLAGWAQQARLALPAYVLHFAASFIVGWAPTAAVPSTLNYMMLAIPAATLLCACTGVALAARRFLRREETGLHVVVLAGMAAIAATLAVHIGFSYQRHLANGWMMDAYPRYYLPLIAVVPLACLVSLAHIERRHLRTALLVLLVGGPVIFRIFGVPHG